MNCGHTLGPPKWPEMVLKMAIKGRSGLLILDGDPLITSLDILCIKHTDYTEQKINVSLGHLNS